ncbi:MAG TPA: hypothetical protein DCG75_00185 [Bacteroidales bacterium]|nr:hypothetical protein [Bacteroidales bacterium]
MGGVAIGTDAFSIGKFSMAFGLNDTAYADYSYAMGVNSVSSGLYSFAIGAANKATRKGAYAIGNLSIASGLGSFALGYQDTASAVNSFAIGYQNHSSNSSAYSIGYQNKSSGVGSFAIGFNNTASGDGSFAIGNLNNATGNSSFAAGFLTTASGSFAISMGNSTIASSGSSTAFGYLSEANGLRSVAGGYGAIANGDYSVAFGSGTTANGESSTAFGNLTQATNYFATSFGASTIASGHTSTAMGNTITVSGYNSFGIGLNATSYTVSQDNTFAVMGGKVGINTVNPDYALDVTGYLNIAKGAIGTGAIVFRVDGDEALWYNGSVFSWGAGAGDGTGYNYFQDNVSIGVSTGTYPLSVAGTANLNQGITSGTVLRANGAEAIYYTGTRFNWGSGGSQNYFPDIVSIGTTDDTYQLNVKSSLQVARIWKDADGTLIRFATGASLATNQGSISVSGATVSYNAFTGSHYAKIKEEIEKGMLVELTGENNYLNDQCESEIIYGGAIALKPNSSNIIGAFLGKEDPDNIESVDLVMAVGNGVMWVVDNGENLETGDYLISSSLAGHAMKDKADYDVSNIVARVAESVNWEKETEMINGIKHKLISVFFERFTINNSNKQFEKEIELLQKTNAELEKRLKLIEQKLNKN